MFFAVMSDQKLNKSFDHTFIPIQITFPLKFLLPIDNIAKIQVESKERVENHLFIIQVSGLTDDFPDSKHSISDQNRILFIQTNHRRIIQFHTIPNPSVNHIRRIHFIHKFFTDQQAQTTEIGTTVPEMK